MKLAHILSYLSSRQRSPIVAAHLTEKLSLLKESLTKAKRTEPLEFSQMLTRYALGIVITLYVVCNPETGTQVLSRSGFVVIMLALAWAVGLGLLVHLMLWPEARIPRRTVSICADAAALSFLIHYGERSAAIFFPVYIWVILGNGFRFGLSYMYASMAANGVGFVIMALTTPYWRQDWQFSVGLLSAIIAIPVYTSSLIRKLRLAMEQAKAASTAKTEFLSMISHELRTPLNAILGLAQVSRLTATTARERENAGFTEIAANRLKRMLDSILKFQAIESGVGHLEKRNFNVLDLLSEIEAILVPLARKKNLDLSFRFKTALPDILTSDPEVIETVIINLATNAIKYTASGFVTIDIGYLDRTTFWLAVRDSGPGIDSDLHTRIFDQFVRRVPACAEDEGGVGLGLSLCKSLVESLGGDIGFESRRGQGSTFWAKIPAEGAWLGNGVALDIKIAAYDLDPATCADLNRDFNILTHCDLQSLGRDEEHSFFQKNYILVADASAMTPPDRECLHRLLAKTASAPALIAIDPSGDATSPLLRHASAVVPSSGQVSPRLVSTVLNWHRRHVPLSAAPQLPVHKDRTILVADDNEMNRRVVAQMLRLDGYTVLEAKGGDDALELLLEGNADVAILDVNMPDQDGVEVCKTYLSIATPETAATVAGLTADISKETRDRCLSAGMVDVLTKPVDLEELRDLLARQSSEPSKAGQIQSKDVRRGEMPVLDTQRITQLLDLFGLDTFREEFLRAFEADALRGIEQLKAVGPLKKPEALQKILHAIKSSARTIGAIRLAEHVASLEDCVLVRADASYDESITRELQVFIDACKEFIEPRVGAHVMQREPFQALSLR